MNGNRKPNIAFVDMEGTRGVEAAYIEGDYYYSPESGDLLAHVDEANVVCEGITVPREEFLELDRMLDHEDWDRDLIIEAALDLMRKSLDLGVFRN